MRLKRRLAGHRDVDQAIAVEVERPPAGVDPHLTRVLADGGPELPGLRRHPRHVVGSDRRRAEQQGYLLARHADGGAAVEGELAGPPRRAEIRMPREIGSHAIVERRSERQRLIEGRQAAIVPGESGHVDLLGGGPLRRALDLGVLARGASGEGEHGAEHGHGEAQATLWPPARALAFLSGGDLSAHRPVSYTHLTLPTSDLV